VNRVEQRGTRIRGRKKNRGICDQKTRVAPPRKHRKSRNRTGDYRRERADMKSDIPGRIAGDDRDRNGIEWRNELKPEFESISARGGFDLGAIRRDYDRR